MDDEMDVFTCRDCGVVFDWDYVYLSDDGCRCMDCDARKERRREC